MSKKNQIEEIRGTEKEFLDCFGKLCSSRSEWQVWEDVITAISCTISNSVDRTPDRWEKREKLYEGCIERLGGVENGAKLFSIIVQTLDTNPNQDFLGKLYMDLDLGSYYKGQFFTPYNVCRAMAEMTMRDVEAQIKEQGYITINDPACGAGATLIAAVNVLCNIKDFNWQNHALFIANDIDPVVAKMCYIQLSLLGCAGYVAVANTLSAPVTGHVLFPNEKEGQDFWYTPMFCSDVWTYRRKFHLMDALLCPNRSAKQTKSVEFPQNTSYQMNLSDLYGDVST